MGVALLGLTQYALIFGLGFFSIQQRMSTATEEFGLGEIIDLQSFPIELIFYAILFFLLGYFLYATLSAMLGSLVSRIEDVQTLIAPMNMLIVVAFFIAMFGMNNPDSIIVTVTSYIPFFAPMIMFLRIGLLSLPAWEIALSIGILLASVVIMGLISARVYRGGVLMYGKFSSWKDLKKAFVMSKRESR
ncbi:MAG TPA: ABC transporter permease [Bacilli bacterium]|nr:ABC transporter permease [Bacilli bacterium]